MHKFPTGNMLFSAGEVISDISRTNTLSPGDVVWLGTDELPKSIGPGDTIEIEISGTQGVSAPGFVGWCDWLDVAVIWSSSVLLRETIGMLVATASPISSRCPRRNAM